MSQRVQPVIYPGSVPEILPSLSTNELIRRLKLLVDGLRDIDQDPNEASKYKSLALHLSSEFLMQSQSKEVKILIACCIADVLRIFAPDAPYADPQQLKRVLVFLIRQLRGLDNPKDPLYGRYFLLLENLAMVKTLNILLELEECQETLTVLFKLTFAILQSVDISEKVQSYIIDILVHIIKDADQLSISVLDALLINLIEPHKTQNRTAYRCAKEVINLTSNGIQPFLESYLLTTISDGRGSESQLAEYVFEIIYEIHKIIPQIMNLVLSQLEDKIKSSETKERLETVRLLTKLFSDKESTVYEDCPTLWTLFLSRFNDINAEIRLQCIKSSVDLLLQQPKLKKDILEVIVHRFRDTDDNVRAQTITAILTVSKKDFSIVNDELLNSVKDRTLDKKFKVRKEAVLCLGTFYRKVITNPESPSDHVKLVSWIKNKLLHMYYQQNMEDKILCEKILNTCLVPYSLETEQRIDKLYQLYCTIDENAMKAFNEIFRQQSHVRFILRSILQFDSSQMTTADATEAQLNRLKQLSEYFLDPRAFDHLKSFYDFLVDDNHAFKLMNQIMDNNYTTKKVEEMVKELLYKVGPQSKFWHLHATVRSLLERSAPVMIDKRGIEYLIGKIRRNMDGLGVEFAFNHDDVQDERISERGFQLILLLSSSFPHCFYSEESLGMLLDFLRDGHTLAADAVIQIFSKVGREKETDFPDIFTNLLPELKKIAQKGAEKQAKHAVFCITKLWPTNNEILSDIFDSVRDDISVDSVYVQSAFACLSTIAILRPEDFHDKLKSIVSVAVVKNIILNDRDHSGCTKDRENDKKWTDALDLSPEAKAKIAAVKYLVSRLIGMKSNEDNHATNTLKLLNGIIESGGNLQDIKMSYADKAHLRLQAGCNFLKLLRDKMFVELMTLRQYRNLCYLICDECPQVREKFAAKLQKNLYSLKLPLEMMAAFALVPLIKPTDSKEVALFRTQVRDCILLNYRRRKEYLRKNPNLQSFPSKYFPEYYLSFVVYLLNYYPEYESYEDPVILRELKECLWFAIEPMLNRKDADKASGQFLYKLLQDIKHTRDVDNPEDMDHSKKMWALCDLGMTLINYRTSNFVSKSPQFKSMLSKRFFTQPKRGITTTNTTIYLPREILEEERRRQYKGGRTSTGGGGGGTSLNASSASSSAKRTAAQSVRAAMTSRDRANQSARSSSGGGGHQPPPAKRPAPSSQSHRGGGGKVQSDDYDDDGGGEDEEDVTDGEGDQDERMDAERDYKVGDEEEDEEADEDDRDENELIADVVQQVVRERRVVHERRRGRPPAGSSPASARRGPSSGGSGSTSAAKDGGAVATRRSAGGASSASGGSLTPRQQVSLSPPPSKKPTLAVTRSGRVSKMSAALLNSN